MRSGEGRKSFAAWSFLLAATLLSFTSTAVHASGKAKPEIPLGEETYEPAAAPKKSTKAEAHAAEKHDSAPHGKTKPTSDKAATEKPTAEKSPSEKAGSGKAPESAPAQAEGTHAEDPHAAPPAAHGETPTDAKAASSVHGEGNKDAQTDAAQPEKNNSLLEGKVPPATPAKGSGFVWFGVIFVLLAIAIFIFT